MPKKVFARRLSLRTLRLLGSAPVRLACTQRGLRRCLVLVCSGRWLPLRGTVVPPPSAKLSGRQEVLTYASGRFRKAAIVVISLTRSQKHEGWQGQIGMRPRGHVRSDAPRTAPLPGKSYSQIYKHMYSTPNLGCPRAYARAASS